MLSGPGAARIYCCPDPVNLRMSFDGLSGAVRRLLGHDPLDGSLYIFLNRRRDMVKVLRWEGDGFSIWGKRLERGCFNMPRSADGRVEIEYRELQAALCGIKPARYYRRYRKP